MLRSNHPNRIVTPKRDDASQTTERLDAIARARRQNPHRWRLQENPAAVVVRVRSRRERFARLWFKRDDWIKLENARVRFKRQPTTISGRA